MAAVDDLIKNADALFARDGGVNPPPEVLLSWPRPNYINPETHDWSGTIVVIAFLGLAIAVYTARIWARLVLAKNAGLDDLIMSIAIIPLIGATISVVLGNRIYGFQWHAWDQTAETFITTRQITLAIEVIYLAATSLIKISILCFYRRITNGSITLTFVYWVWASIAFVIAYFIAFTFVIVFSCTPVEGYWHLFDIAWRLQNELKCHNEGAEIVSVVIISTLQDFFICALPVFLVWNLQIPRRQKAALIALFGVGLLTCVCGIMRTYYAIYVYYYTYDITWYAYYGWIWTALEADLGVICASAPALKVFFKRYFNLTMNRSGASGSNSNGRKTPKVSPGNSFGTGNLEDTKWEPDPVPLDRIQVRTGTDVIVEDRDDVVSQGSNSSTRNLTALPSPPVDDHSSSSEWIGSRTVCSAFRPGSRGSRKQSGERDLEMHASAR